jgi:hypothetical protein
VKRLQHHHAVARSVEQIVMGFDDTALFAMVLAELLEPFGAMVEDLKAARHQSVA